MENRLIELSEKEQSIRICLYTCIPENEEFKRQRYPFQERVKATLRNSINEFRTSVTGNLHLDTYSYTVANGLADNSNRGDLAIRMAIQSQLRSAFAPRPVHFFEVGWGKLTQQNVDYINRHADLFVIAGGGYIFVNGDGSPGAMLADSASLTRLNCSVVAYGIGLNRLMHERPCPLPELRPETQNKVRQLSTVCREIGVRDRDTAELFALYGDKAASVTGDPVLYFSEIDPPTTVRSGPLRIGVNLAAHGWRGYSILEAILPHITSHLLSVQNNYGADITYFLHHDLEHPIVEYLRRKGLRLKLIDGTARHLIDSYREVDFVINQMLHSCIFAANAGVPFLNLAYDKKSVAFCSLLEIPECAVEHSQVTQELLTKKFDGLLKDRSELSKRILDKKIWLRSESRNFLEKVITSTAEKEAAGSLVGLDRR